VPPSVGLFARSIVGNLGRLRFVQVSVNRIVLGLLAFVCLTACDQSAPAAVSSTVAGIEPTSPPSTATPETTSPTPSSTTSTQPTMATTSTMPTTTATTPPTETPTEGTPAPRPLFGLFDNEQTFAASDDLAAAVGALRNRYRVIATVAIAVPTGSHAHTTVRFIGMLSSDGQPSVLIVVEVGGDQMVEVSALPSAFIPCSPSPDTHWQTVTIRGDVDGCVSVSPPGGSQDGQWHEGSETWWYSAGPANESPEAWLSGLRMISPADTAF